MDEILAFLNLKWLATFWGIVSGIAGGAFGYFFGGCAESIAWLFCVMVVDFFLGTLCAWRCGKWKSRLCKNGLMAKVIILSLCAGGYGLDTVAHTTFIQSSIIAAFMFAEFGSCLENIECLGYGYIIPQAVRDLLSQVKDKQIRLGEKNENRIL